MPRRETLNRERWLGRLAGRFRLNSCRLNHPLPEQLRVTCGLPSHDALRRMRRVIGHCCTQTCSTDDSNKNLVPGCSIATVSLGKERVFRLSPGKHIHGKNRDFCAEPGSVIEMPWDLNKTWKRGVPKKAQYSGRQVSVTFRAFSDGVLPPEEYFEIKQSTSHRSVIRRALRWMRHRHFPMQPSKRGE